MPRSSRQTDSRRSEGFTLVELMMVVTIIGVMVGLAAPTMMDALADGRVGDLTGQVVNVYNGARARAQGSGRAQLVRYTAAAYDGHGGLAVYEGNNSSCAASNWVGITNLGCPSRFCVDQLNPRQYQVAGELVRLGLRTTGTAGTFGESAADMCFEPSGVTFWRVGTEVAAGGSMSSSNSGAGGNLKGGFLMRIQRLDSEEDQRSPDRTVAIALGAAARVAR